MSEDRHVQLVIVGSIGIDTIQTPFAKRESILGGSASYACAAASFFAPVGMVGVVGSDFPRAYEDLYRKFNINLDGLQSVEGETFRWSGVYHENMDSRETLMTELNVFADFSPTLPDAYRKAPYLFLANIGPNLQQEVLNQVDGPEFVAMDTMDLWINTQRDTLVKVISQVDLLTLNESEARHLTGEHFLPVAARRLLEIGPKYVLIKKGEHGSMLFYKDGVVILPAYPLHAVQDPTGAGDVFAGGLMGALAAHKKASHESIHSGMLYGSVLASFAVEAFSLEKLEALSMKHIESRAGEYRDMIRVPAGLKQA